MTPRHISHNPNPQGKPDLPPIEFTDIVMKVTDSDYYPLPGQKRSDRRRPSPTRRGHQA